MKHTRLFAAILCAAPPFAYAATGDTSDEIVVTATRIAQPLNQTLAHTSVISRQDIRNAQAVDVPSVLRDLAGVEFYQSGGIGKQSSLFLRGANSSHVLILLDGVRINSATTGSTELDQLMLDQVERIEVVRGNASSLYGSEAIGGVIQIFTRHGGGAPCFNASAGIGTHNTRHVSAGFSGQSGDADFSVQASHYKTAGVSAIKPSIVPTVNPDRDGYDNTSLSASLHYALDMDNGLAVSLLDSQGSSQNDNSFGLPTDVNTSKSHIQKLSLLSDNRINATWHSKLQLAQGVDDTRNFLNGMPDIALGALFKTVNNQVTWQNALQFDENSILNLGAEGLTQQVASDTAYTRNKRTAHSLFAGYTGNFGAHQLQANLREDRYSDFGVADTGLLGYGYAINEKWRATAVASTAFKAPTLNDLYYPLINYGTFGGVTYSYQGNPNLKPERSRNAELGMHYTAGGQQVDVAYFDSRIRDLIASNGLAAGSVINLSQARNEGWEFSYDGQFGDTGVKAALTLQNPRDGQTGQLLVRRARSYGSIGITQRLGLWKVGGECQFSGPRVDYDINTFARTTLSGYQVVNLTANYALDKHLNLSLRADNVFNRDYMLAHGYNTLGRTVFVAVNYQQ
ncbi:MAG: TonB-dependent receptor [Sideroxydans sp.]|nr:TonB-dependent receptor [Sideroxydans sp.]